MSRQSIAESHLNVVEWITPTKAYVECPGKQHHTGANGKRDCELHLDGAPTVTCFHDSCSLEVEAMNKQLRSEIGRAEKKGVSYKFDATPAPAPPPFVRPYEVDPSIKLPDPIPDGTRELLKAAFLPGEGVRIAQGRTNDEGREIPKDSGVCLSREEWLKKLDANGGNPNKFLQTEDKNGIFISVNPLKIGGSKDADVIAFRHCLLEFDAISAEEQWALIKQTGVPASAVISSGGKSVHAWVKIDAKNRKEYDERCVFIYNHFAEWRPDEKNKNPSRFSRLANCERGKKRQELLAINIGAKSFSEWRAGIEVEGIGTRHPISKLMAFNPLLDPNTVLGKRWLCRGGSCLFVGQSGIGKSSLAVQAAVTWAMGRSFFGVLPAKPLKSLFVQAENDIGDLAEMVQGVLQALGVEAGTEAYRLVEENVVIISDTIHVAQKFCESVHRLIDQDKPDLVWADPLLSFIGDDISKQSVCSQFLREWLGPIAAATGVIWMFIHHTGKPSTDPKSKRTWTSTDFAYSGIGSSELTNWARAVCVLSRINETTFELKFAKRGKRAGAQDATGCPATSVYLQHAAEGIKWEQCAKPEEKEKSEKSERYGASKKEEKPEKPESKSAFERLLPQIDGFLNTFTGTRTMSEAEEAFMGFAKFNLSEDISKSTAKNAINKLCEYGLLEKKEFGRGKPCEIRRKETKNLFDNTMLPSSM